MNSNSDDKSLSIEVLGVGVAVTKHIVEHLTKYTTQMVTSGVKGVVLEIKQTTLTIRLARHQANANYLIAVREDIGYRISRAIDRIEYHPEIRPEIKKKVISELFQDLDEMFIQIRQEMSQSR